MSGLLQFNNGSVVRSSHILVANGPQLQNGKSSVETAILKNEQTGGLTLVNPDWFELLGWEEQLGTDVYI